MSRQGAHGFRRVQAGVFAESDEAGLLWRGGETLQGPKGAALDENNRNR